MSPKSHTKGNGERRGNGRNCGGPSGEGDDAGALIDHTKIVGGESDNLTFGSEGIQKTVEQERELIESLVDSSSSIFLVAVMEGQIVGTCNFNAFVRHKRISHRGEFGIAVQKRAWGKGVGTMLMARMLDFAKHTAHVEVVSCEVRSDNLRAIALYRKFGFGKVGTFHKFFKIGDTYADCDLMNLYV